MAAKNSDSAPEGAAVADLGQGAPPGRSWTALGISGTLQWFDRGTDVVNTAANAALGAVRGDGAGSGKVAVEADGSMAVNTAANAALGVVKGNNAATAPEKIKIETDGSMTIKVNELVKVIGSMLFPVGSLYCTNSTANPSSLLGFGTWSRIAGRFIRSSASQAAGGVTGGDDTASMPSHTHSFGRNLPAPGITIPYSVIVTEGMHDTQTDWYGEAKVGNIIENSRGIKVVPCTDITDGNYDSIAVHHRNGSSTKIYSVDGGHWVNCTTRPNTEAASAGGDNKPAYYDTNVWVRTA
jgi:hypothetical protein